MQATQTDRSEYQAAYRLVAHVMTWQWPHKHVVYPRDRFIPILDSAVARRGYSKLSSVREYLAAQARRDLLSTESA